MSSIHTSQASQLGNLVHETETQRQYVRAKVPGTLELQNDGSTRRFKLLDLSGGGLSFAAGKGAFSAGQTCSGKIKLKLESITVEVPLQFQVRYVDSDGRVGARFEQIDPTQIATIRRVVSSFLGGELIGAGELMHTLSRNNFTSPRGGGNGRPPKRGFLGHFRALAQTSLIVVLGIVAVVYVGQKLGEKFFGANSLAARVTGPSFDVEMPRDGVFRSLIPDDGVVKKGSPIGTFETSMLGLVSRQALEAELSQSEIDAMLGKEIKGTVTSPCDCRVTTTYVTNEQYLREGQRLVSLTPLEFEPFVIARFAYGEAGNLEAGTPVSLKVNGDPISHKAKVTQIRHDGDPNVLSQDLVVVVKPDKPLPSSMIARPAHVSIDTEHWFSGAEQLMDAGSAHAEASP